jgi:hypothetical protein
MKRRAFIRTAVATTVVIAIPAVYFGSRPKGRKDPLIMPSVLERFCDETEIQKIGDQYMSQAKVESTKEKLIELLLSNNGSKSNKALSNSEIDELLGKKIKEEFSAYKTVIVNGWVISPTEARQCALFSLNRN